jgi:hypothetical protein
MRDFFCLCGKRMRIASIFLIILFSAPAAMAQTRPAIPGKPLTLYRGYSTNPDCTDHFSSIVDDNISLGSQPSPPQRLKRQRYHPVSAQPCRVPRVAR